jgi:RimJ/RimL family protein N-acetyltransferase
MITPWRLQTARLTMTPVAPRDLRELTLLKAAPLAFAQMLGGVRSAQQTAEELAHDIQYWGKHGYGIWSVRARAGNAFLGLAGLMHRPDGLGVALRYAFWPEARGIGLASEAAFAAITYGHEAARLPKIVAVTREDNHASRTILGAIGMSETGGFKRDGIRLLVYKSERQPNAG